MVGLTAGVRKRNKLQVDAAELNRNDAALNRILGRQAVRKSSACGEEVVVLRARPTGYHAGGPGPTCSRRGLTTTSERRRARARASPRCKLQGAASRSEGFSQ